MWFSPNNQEPSRQCQRSGKFDAKFLRVSAPATKSFSVSHRPGKTFGANDSHTVRSFEHSPKYSVNCSSMLFKSFCASDKDNPSWQPSLSKLLVMLQQNCQACECLMHACFPFSCLAVNIRFANKRQPHKEKAENERVYPFPYSRPDPHNLGPALLRDLVIKKRRQHSKDTCRRSLLYNAVAKCPHENLRRRLDFVRVLSGKGEIERPKSSPRPRAAKRKSNSQTIRSPLSV